MVRHFMTWKFAGTAHKSWLVPSSRENLPFRNFMTFILEILRLEKWNYPSRNGWFFRAHLVVCDNLKRQENFPVDLPTQTSNKAYMLVKGLVSICEVRSMSQLENSLKDQLLFQLKMHFVQNHKFNLELYQRAPWLDLFPYEWLRWREWRPDSLSQAYLAVHVISLS